MGAPPFVGNQPNDEDPDPQVQVYGQPPSSNWKVYSTAIVPPDYVAPATGFVGNQPTDQYEAPLEVEVENQPPSANWPGTPDFPPEIY